MRMLFKGQVPKEAEFPDDNEDAFELSDTGDRVVVSDGASESFDSQTWARLLTKAYIDRPELNELWLADAINDYVASINPSTLSWSKQSAFARGSFATLLAVEQLAEGRLISVLGIGDSLAALLDGPEFIDSFPYLRAEEFQQHPELVCTIARQNSLFHSPENLSKRYRTWSVHNTRDPVVLCMTDALGEWALRSAQEGNPQWQQLCEIKELAELELLVYQERQSKAMRVDDTTLLRLSFSGWEPNELPNS